MPQYIRDEDLRDIGTAVCEEALEIFDAAGCSHDFCIQSTGFNTIFGGTNRLSWNPNKGFRAIHTHCTHEFITKTKELGFSII